MKRLLARPLAFLLPFFFLGTAHGADGDFDATFGTDGIVMLDFFPDGRFWQRLVAIQPGGKLIVAGSFSADVGESAIIVLRLDQSGAIDPAFGLNSQTTLDIGAGFEVLGDLVIAPDGSILLSAMTGLDEPDAQTAVAKLDPNGVLASDFGTGGIATRNISVGREEAGSIALAADGKIYVGGRNNFVLAFNPNGSPDTSFDGDGLRILPGSPVFVSGKGLAVDSTGRIVVTGGNSSLAANASDQDIQVMRLLPNGQNDPGFGTDGRFSFPFGSAFDAPQDLAIDAAGNILISMFNEESAVSTSGVARVLPDGSLDPTFGNGGIVTIDFPDIAESRIQAIEILPDGRIVVTGVALLDSNDPNRFLDLFVVVLSDDGTPDPAFSANGWQQLNNFNRVGIFSESNRDGVAISPGGRLYAIHNQCECVAALRLPRWDLTPDGFALGALTGVPTGSLQVSESITLSGLTPDVNVPVAVAGGAVRKNASGDYFERPVWIGNGDTLRARHTSALAPQTTTTTTVRIGGLLPKNNRMLQLGAKTTSMFESTTAAGPSIDDRARRFDKFRFGRRISNATVIDFEGRVDPGESQFLGDPGQFEEGGVTIANTSSMFIQNNNLYGTQSFLSPQLAPGLPPPEIVTFTLPAGTRAVAFSYQSAQATLVLDGGQTFSLPAVPGGTLGFFSVARVLPLESFEITIDGLGMDIDDVMVSADFDFSALPRVINVPELDGSGDTALVAVRDGSIVAEVRDRSSGRFLRNLFFLDDGFTPVDAAWLPDADGDGSSELAVLATRNADGRIVVEMRNLAGTPAPRRIFFSDGHTPLALRVIEGDADGDGIPEIAVLMRRDNDGRGRVEVKNAFGPKNTQVVWAAAGLDVIDVEIVADADSNGVPEVAILSRRRADDRNLVEVKNAVGPANASAVFFMADTTALDLAAVSDADTNGIPEVAVVSMRNADGRALTEVKNARGQAQTRTLWLAPGHSPVRLAAAGDSDGNGIDELAVLMNRNSDGRIVVEVKNADGGPGRNRIFYTPGFVGEDAAVINDADGNGIPEVGVLMIRDSDDRILVQRRNLSGDPLPVNYWMSP